MHISSLFSTSPHTLFEVWAKTSLNFGGRIVIVSNIELPHTVV